MAPDRAAAAAASHPAWPPPTTTTSTGERVVALRAGSRHHSPAARAGVSAAARRGRRLAREKFIPGGPANVATKRTRPPTPPRVPTGRADDLVTVTESGSTAAYVRYAQGVLESGKCGSVTVTGAGRAVYKAVTVAETLKRVCKQPLYQVWRDGGVAGCV